MIINIFKQFIDISKKYFTIIINNLKIKDILFFSILILYLFNVVQSYYIYSNSIVIKELDRYELARIDNKSYLNNLQNNNYTEVFMKSHQYKKVDEIIIETSNIEDDLKIEKDQYIKYYKNNRLQNWQVWINCYLGDNIQKTKCFNNEK